MLVNSIYPDFPATFMTGSAGKPYLEKSKKNKDRAIWLYASSSKMYRNWGEAEKQRFSLFRFLSEVVDNDIRMNLDGITSKEGIQTELRKTSTGNGISPAE